jgi:manganese efflux pump family protein
MELVHAVLLAIVLSVDSFSAALALGFKPFSRGQAFAFALSSGLAEGVVSGVGFWCGRNILSYIADYDHWIAFLLLLAVGLHVLWEAIKKLQKRDASEAAHKQDGFHSFQKVLLVSFVTSLDALGVGLGLGVAHRSAWLYSPVIGVAAFFATLLGLSMAKSLSRRLGLYAEVLGGLVLIALAFPLLRI